MLIEWPPMRPMDLDPSFVPYLKNVVAGRTVPIQHDNIVERRARMTALRRESAPPPPSDVSISNQAIAAGDHEIPVRIYRPVTWAPHPGIVYFHGGGWMFGSAEQSDSIAIRYCRAADAVVVSPDYRLSPEHPFPAGFEDCRNALMWTFRSSKLLGIDADRIAVAGESSGANLAAACAIDVRDSGAPPLALQVLVYPALGLDFDTTSYVENAAAPVLSRDEMTFFWKAYLAANSETQDPRAAPLVAPDLSGLAPAWIASAEYDPLREDGARYARRLTEAGVSVDYRNAERLTHGFMRAWSVSDDVQAIGAAIIAALRGAFGEADWGGAGPGSRCRPRSARAG